MCTTDQIHVVLGEEPRNDIRAEGEGYATVIFTPAGDVLVWIGPQQVTEQPTVGDLLKLAQRLRSRDGLEHICSGS